LQSPTIDIEGLGKDQLSSLSSALVIPDSFLAKEATDLLREYSADLLMAGTG
jgi:hypothetical protein